MMKKVVVLLFCLLLLPFAASELIVNTYQFNPNIQFSVQSSELNLCSCGFSQTTYTLRNVGSQPDRVTLLSNQDYVVLSQNIVDLQPGDVATIIAYIHTPCGTSSDNLLIRLNSIYGQQKDIIQPISINNCQNLKVSTSQQNIQTNACEQFTSTLLIENIGPHSETYTIIPKSLREFATISQENITIAQGETSKVTVFYNPACDIIGDFDLDYEVRTRQSNLKAEVSQALSIVDNYNYSINLVGIEPTCALDQNVISLQIQNNNDFENIYDIEVSGPDFVSPIFPEVDGQITSKIALPANSITQVDFEVNANDKFDAGNHTVTVTVTPKYGQAQSSSTEFTIYNCFDFENLIADIPTQYFCGDDEVLLQVPLSHKGFGEPEVNFQLTSNYSEINESIVTFVGQEEKELTIYFDIPQDLDVDETLTLEAYFRDNLVVSESFLSSVNDRYACYETAPVKNSVPIFFDSEYFTVDLHHIGDRYSEYEVELINSPSYVSLETNELNLERGQFDQLLFAIDVSQLQQEANYYNNGSIILLKGTIEIELIHEYEIYTYELDLEFIDYPWYTKTARQIIATDICLLIFGGLFILTLITFIVFMVRVSSKKRVFKSNGLAALIIGLILIAAVIAVIINFGIPTKDTYFTQHDLETNSTILIYMQEDDPLTINYNDFFFDPDNDISNYGVFRINNSILTTSQQKENLTLIPAQDYHGTTEIELYVEDAFGEIAFSERIIVQVFPVEDYTLLELFLLTCMYVNLVLLWVLGILVYVSSSMKLKEKEEQLKLK